MPYCVAFFIKIFDSGKNKHNSRIEYCIIAGYEELINQR